MYVWGPTACLLVATLETLRRILAAKSSVVCHAAGCSDPQPAADILVLGQDSTSACPVVWYQMAMQVAKKDMLARLFFVATIRVKLSQDSAPYFGHLVVEYPGDVALQALPLVILQKTSTRGDDLSPDPRRFFSPCEPDTIQVFTPKSWVPTVPSTCLVHSLAGKWISSLRGEDRPWGFPPVPTISLVRSPAS